MQLARSLSYHKIAASIAIIWIRASFDIYVQFQIEQRIVYITRMVCHKEL